MYTVDVSQDPALYQIPQTDRSVSTDICRKIKMLTSLCIWLDSIVIMIAKQKNFMPCLDLCGKFRAAHIAEADEGITSCHLVIDDPDLFLWGESSPDPSEDNRRHSDAGRREDKQIPLLTSAGIFHTVF